MITITKGINFAEVQNKKILTENFQQKKFNTPIIFLSHKSEDKNFVELIGKYLIECGINIYLDKLDSNLQKAVVENDYKQVTECIHTGIKYSTHILCIVSEKTIKSWWVPYELGYAKSCNKKISSLVSKNTKIPEYLKIEKVMTDVAEIIQYVTLLKQEKSNFLFESFEGKPIKDFAQKNNLYKYLN